MLVVYAVIILAWLLMRADKNPKTLVLLSVGLITSFIVAIMASLLPITEILIGENEALRVFSPAAYPFCIQQYRDYDVGIFGYILSFGWPEGIPLVQTSTYDDQSEFIHYEHYSIGLALGLLLLLCMVALVGILTFIDRKGILIRSQPIISSVPVLVLLQLSLILLLTSPYLLGAIVYELGGLSVLFITFYVTVREIRFGKTKNTEDT
ncbi:MAG: hypothetical protein P1Q69_02340 [Candidatus Thorarchaeota archaeon]|nr:hypothetical protein [Candidatus Thorarchaeota archaeon]